MIITQATFGISLTSEFGSIGKGVHSTLKENIQALQEDVYQESSKEPNLTGLMRIEHVQSCPTAEDYWLVAGFAVSEKELSSPESVANFRNRWDALMADLSEETRTHLFAIHEPSVVIMAGKC